MYSQWPWQWLQMASIKTQYLVDTAPFLFFHSANQIQKANRNKQHVAKINGAMSYLAHDALGSIGALFSLAV